jgi:hypothetical protein
VQEYHAFRWMTPPTGKKEKNDNALFVAREPGSEGSTEAEEKKVGRDARGGAGVVTLWGWWGVVLSRVARPLLRSAGKYIYSKRLKSALRVP